VPPPSLQSNPRIFAVSSPSFSIFNDNEVTWLTTQSPKVTSGAGLTFLPTNTSSNELRIVLSVSMWLIISCIPEPELYPTMCVISSIEFVAALIALSVMSDFFVEFICSWGLLYCCFVCLGGDFLIFGWWVACVLWV